MSLSQNVSHSIVHNVFAVAYCCGDSASRKVKDVVGMCLGGRGLVCNAKTQAVRVVNVIAGTSTTSHNISRGGIFPLHQDGFHL